MSLDGFSLYKERKANQMKHKIIAIFTACCMICGAFAMNAINTTDNTIKASAAEDSKRETRHGSLTRWDYSSHGYFGDIHVSNLDSLKGFEASYNGDSTSDIDWSKCTDVRTTGKYGSFVEVEWDENTNDFVIKDSTWGPYSYSGKVTFSFEDMDFIIDLEYITVVEVAATTSFNNHNWYTTTSRTTTTTTRTTNSTTATYTYTYPVTTTATYEYTYTYTYPHTTTTRTTNSTTATYTYTYPRTTTTRTTNSTTATYDYIYATTSFINHNWYTTTSRTTTTTTKTTNSTTATYTYTYPQTTTTTVSSLMIIPSSVNMKIGDTNRLAVIGVSNLSDIVWTSGDTSIATVSDNGTVTAKGKGSTVIYAVYNGNVAVCTINISNNNNSMIPGDANGDNSVDIADATAIVQHMGNPDEYALSEQGKINADIVNQGDGVTGADAVVLQLLEAKKIKQSDFPITMEQYNALLNE